MRQKPRVAFICVHNSCRSQIAEALGRYLASDVFESYSAGTETVPQINQDAVRLMWVRYGNPNGANSAQQRTSGASSGGCSGDHGMQCEVPIFTLQS